LAEAARTRWEKYISRTLLEWIKNVSPNGEIPAKSEIEKAYIPPVNEDSTRISEELLSASFLLGMDHASANLDLSDGSLSIEPLAFEDAVSFLKHKVSVTKDEWNDLEPKLRFRAFTMARLADLDYIEAARGRLISAMEKGEGLSETWNDIQAIAKENGSAMSPGYWETVYRTSTQTSYNAGRRKEFERNPPDALALIVIEDGRTSSICRPLVGLVLPYSHAFWKSNWPPFHFNCRTTVRGIYQAEINRGVQVENYSMNQLRKMFKPQSGFGGNPFDDGTWFMLHSGQMMRGIKYGVITEFNKAENVIADYDTVWKDYSRVKNEKGGWYDVYKEPPQDWMKNKPVVERLSSNGYRIKVLPELKNVPNQPWKNPDVFIDGVLSDIKEPVSMTSNAVKNALKSAQGQNLETVILSLKSEMPVDELKKGLRGRIFMKENKIKRVILLFHDEIFDLSDEAIRKSDFGF